ncbi:MAG: GntR family transcriptional regulator [Alphaproteobacteria bacterium]|nr:GntR family transcriptional regulator [Alphaproteobacteria bacterium]
MWPRARIWRRSSFDRFAPPPFPPAVLGSGTMPAAGNSGMSKTPFRGAAGAFGRDDLNWTPSRVAQTLSLSEQIAGNVGNAIIRGDYQPGQRVQEQELADQFHVSRGPVREALRLLERDGLVQIHARRGAHVTQLGRDEVSDLFEVRIVLIGLAAKIIAENRNPDVVREIRRGVEQLGRLVKDRAGTDSYVGAIYRLNLVLAEGSGNPYLGDMIFSLAHRTLRYARLGLSTEARRQQSVRTWRQVIAAIERGDADAARAQAEKLVRASRDMAVSLLPAPTSKPD